MKIRNLLPIISIVLLLSLGCSTSDLFLTPTPGGTGAAQPQTQATAAAPVVAPVTQGDALAALQSTLENIYQTVGPSVVYIGVVQKQEIGPIPFPFFGQEQQPPEQYQRGSGSGFVWDTAGHIVTNNHVVEGADKIQVTFADGTTAPASIVGTDRDSDLAVLQVETPSGYTLPAPLTLADSTQVQVGQLAVAIGNPFGLENTMTVGFISALGRSLPTGGADGGPSYSIPDVIQTDAPINPGNSGGVLVDAEGRVIGVTSAIVSPVRASAGIGFAIPAAIVQKVVPVLIESGHYTYPWLGISGTSLDADLADAMGLDPNQHGALVIEVVPNGPADEAGLRGSSKTVVIDGEQRKIGGDVIIAIEEQPVKDFADLVAYLVNHTEVGQRVTLTIVRDGREQEVTVTLGERPSGESSQQQTGQEEAAGGAWLGISGLTLTPKVAQAMGLPADQTGVLVGEVVSGSPADEAGLRGSYKPVTIGGERILVGGDVIVAFDGRPVARMEDLQAMVRQASPGERVTLTVLRDGREQEIEVTLGSRE